VLRTECFLRERNVVMPIRTVLGRSISITLLLSLGVGSRISDPERRALAEDTRADKSGSTTEAGTFVPLDSDIPLSAGIRVFVEKVPFRTKSARLAICSTTNKHVYVSALELKQAPPRSLLSARVFSSKKTLVIPPNELIVTRPLSFVRTVFTNRDAYLRAHPTENPSLSPGNFRSIRIADILYFVK